MYQENNKEVRFDIYCEKCEHWKKKDHDDPCNECLAVPYNLNSCKPVYYKEKE